MALQDLITTAELLAAWPQASALASSEQTALVTAASTRFELEADRDFFANTYQEIYRPGRTRKLYLRQKPVTTISRIATDFCSVMILQNNDPTVSEATVGYSGPTVPEDALSGTGITLNAIVAGLPATPVTLLFATYPTMATLAAQVNATPGWSATVATGGPSNEASFAKFPTSYLCFDAGQMGATSPYGASLNAFTRPLSYVCDRELARRATVELLEGAPDGYRYPDRRNGAYGWWMTSVSGIAGGADPRIGGVQVSYAAGYAIADVPAEIKRATIGIAKFFYAANNASGAYKSQQFKDYKYEIFERLELPQWIRSIAFNVGRKEIV